jgi:hypothetical protein
MKLLLVRTSRRYPKHVPGRTQGHSQSWPRRPRVFSRVCRGTVVDSSHLLPLGGERRGDEHRTRASEERAPIHH